ncbi:Gfo/Idh/MocA family oxidoreductase [Halanaerocella petrolearia]
MKKIKIGIIGTGLAWQRLHWPAYQQLQDKYEIVACCDVELEVAEAATELIGINKDKAYEDYKTMIKEEELDAVDIMVPISQNFAVSKDVAELGLDIICEKPLATNLEEAKEYTKFPKEYDIKVLIAENFRYNEENNILKNLVAEEKVGEIIYFISNFIVNFPQEALGDTFAAKEWRQHPAFPGGRLLDGALHNLAGLRHIFGPIHSLQAFGKPQEDDYVPYLSTNINLHFENGIVGQFSYFPSGKEMQRPLVGTRIFGRQGMIYLEERKSGVINIAYNDGTREEINYTPKQGFYNELVNFYQGLTDKEDISVTPEIELGDVKTVLSILKSVEENKTIEVNQ